MTKRILLATVSSLAIVGAASGADMAARAPMYTKAPAAALPAWAGFYLGVNGGYARLNLEHTHIDGGGCGLTNGIGSQCDVNVNGGVFGGQVGYNWQSGAWVYGLEGDMDWAWLKRDVTTSTFQHTVLRAKVDALGSLRGRIGFVEANTLFYATGGAAWGHLKSGWGASGLPPSGTCCATELSTWKAGWVIGAGVEHMLTPNWLVRAEALYYNLGRTTDTFSAVGSTYQTEFKHDVIVGRVGVSYKW